MTSIRVWLTEWEWACCGAPFAAGDRITLDVGAEKGSWFSEMLGRDLADEIDAVESHHEEGGPDRVTGVVTAIQAVTLEHTRRREPRPPRPHPPAPIPLGDSVWAVAGSTNPWVTIVEPVPDSASLVPAPHVPWPARDAGPDVDDRPPRGLEGYLVELEVG